MTEPGTVPGGPNEPASQPDIRLKRPHKVSPFASTSKQESPPGSAPLAATVAPAVPSDAQAESPKPGVQGDKRRIRFEERYDRITLYLEKPVHSRVRELYGRGDIDNMSEMFNAAVKNYLSEHYYA